MLGNFKKQIQEEEKEMLKISRKSPYYVGNFLKEKNSKKRYNYVETIYWF